MLTKLKPYNKFLVAVVGAVVTVVEQQFAGNKYVAMAVAVLTALGVYGVKNA